MSPPVSATQMIFHCIVGFTNTTKPSAWTFDSLHSMFCLVQSLQCVQVMQGVMEDLVYMLLSSPGMEMPHARTLLAAFAAAALQAGEATLPAADEAVPQAGEATLPAASHATLHAGDAALPAVGEAALPTAGYATLHASEVALRADGEAAPPCSITSGGGKLEFGAADNASTATDRLFAALKRTVTQMQADVRADEFAHAALANARYLRLAEINSPTLQQVHVVPPAVPPRVPPASSLFNVPRAAPRCISDSAAVAAAPHGQCPPPDVQRLCSFPTDAATLQLRQKCEELLNLGGGASGAALEVLRTALTVRTPAAGAEKKRGREDEQPLRREVQQSGGLMSREGSAADRAQHARAPSHLRASSHIGAQHMTTQRTSSPTPVLAGQVAALETCLMCVLVPHWEAVVQWGTERCDGITRAPAVVERTDPATVSLHRSPPVVSDGDHTAPLPPLNAAGGGNDGGATLQQLPRNTVDKVNGSSGTTIHQCAASSRFLPAWGTGGRCPPRRADSVAETTDMSDAAAAMAAMMDMTTATAAQIEMEAEGPVSDRCRAGDVRDAGVRAAAARRSLQARAAAHSGARTALTLVLQWLQAGHGEAAADVPPADLDDSNQQQHALAIRHPSSTHHLLDRPSPYTRPPSARDAALLLRRSATARLAAALQPRTPRLQLPQPTVPLQLAVVMAVDPCLMAFACACEGGLCDALLLHCVLPLLTGCTARSADADPHAAPATARLTALCGCLDALGVNVESALERLLTTRLP